MKILKRIGPILGCILAFACNQKAEPEEYLIPAGFAGKVNILFGRSDGTAKEYEGGRRVYKIPSTGILLTQFNATAGFIDRKYYSVDEGGRRAGLEVFKSDHNTDGSVRWLVEDKSKKGIFLDGTNGQYGSTGDPRAVQFEEFVVSSQKMLDSFFTKEYLRTFDNRIEKVTGLTLNLK
jgi:hypothetical protein